LTARFLPSAGSGAPGSVELTTPDNVVLALRKLLNA
jgi:hypothetical protein